MSRWIRLLADQGTNSLIYIWKQSIKGFRGRGGGHRGFGFVTFGAASEQHAAIKALNQKKMGNKTLNVRAVEDKGSYEKRKSGRDEKSKKNKKLKVCALFEMTFICKLHASTRLVLNTNLVQVACPIMKRLDQKQNLYQ